MEEYLVQSVTLILQDMRLHFDSGSLQYLDSTTGYQRVRIVGADIDFSDATLDDDVRAGRGFPGVTAGLQCHVKLGTGDIFCTIQESVAFCMVSAVALMPSLGDDATVLHHDATHHGIRIYEAFAPARQFDGPTHILIVSHCSLLLKNQYLYST